LKDDSRGGSASRSTGLTRTGLVIAETAFAVMLLAGAGLLIKSFIRLQDVNPGFSSDRVLTAQITLQGPRYADAPARRAFWSSVLEKARVLPGVTAAGLTNQVPFNGNVSSGSYSVVGYTPGPTEAAPHGRQEVASGDYFTAMKIPLVEGRVFNDSDTADSTPVVVVDELMAKKYFAGKSAIGGQIRRGGPDSPPITIIGVVKTISAIDLAQPVEKERLYRPVMQQPQFSMAVILKTGLEPETLIGQLRATIQSIDPEQPIADVRTMEQWISRSLGQRRAPTMLLVLFGSVALVLSAIGIYGVLAFGVAQRVRELGIRQALGADRGSIMSLVLRQGLMTAGMGIVLGLGLSLWLSRHMESQLFGVGQRDPVVFVSVAVLLFLVALAACYIPARRATQVDPMVALRDS